MRINSQMKRAKLALSVCGLLGSTAFLSPTLAAQLGPFQIPFSFTAFDGCVSPNGTRINENILFTGILQVTATETANSLGGFHIDEILDIQNGKGTGLSSGTLYKITQIFAIPQNNGPRFAFDTDGASVQTDFSFELQAKFVDTRLPRVANGLSFFLRETVNADGTLTNLRVDTPGVACG